MEGQVLKYPQLSAAAVRFANSLNRQGANNLEITSADHSYSLRPESAAQSSEFPATIQCSINGREVQLGFDAGLYHLLLSDWLALEDIAKLPDDLRKSVITAALTPISDFFSKHSVGSFNVEDIVCEPAKPPRTSLFFSLRSAEGAVVGSVYVATDKQTIATLYKIGQATAKPSVGINKTELPIQVEVIADNTRLSLAEFRQLKEGDIILFDKAFSDIQEVCARIGDKIYFSSVIDENKLIIRQLIQKPGGVRDGN